MSIYPHSTISKSLLISLAILSLVYVAFGMYLEDNEAIVAAVNYGLFGRFGPEQYASDYQTFLLPVLNYLSLVFRSVPVYGIWKFLYGFLALTSIVYYLINALEVHKRGTVFNITIGVLLILIFTIDSFFYSHCVRHSILLGFAALAINWQNIDSKGRASKFAIAIFILSVIARMHSAVIILCIFIAFHVLRGLSPIAVLRHHAAMIVIGCGFVFAYQVYGEYNTNFGKYIEANYEYAIIEKASLHPIGTMKTKEDSVKYQALAKFFITDSIEFDKSFFNRAVNLDYHQKLSWQTLNLAPIFHEFASKLHRLAYMPWIFVFLAIVIFIGTDSLYQLRQSFWLLFLSFGAMAALLFALVDEIKIRFFSPYVGMVLFLLFMTYLPGFLARAGKNTKRISLLILIFILGLSVRDVYGYAMIERLREEKIKDTSARLQAYFEQHPTLTFMGADIPFRADLFFRPSPDLYSHMASFDGAYLIYFSYSHDRFDHLFSVSPHDYRGLISLFEHRKDIRFYALPQRLELVRLYFRTIYHVDLVFERESPAPLLHLNGTMYSVTVNRNP